MTDNVGIIKGMIDFIEDHLKEDINLSQLADAAGYSRYHLHRMFTALVGFPVHQYIRRRQLTEAAQKLLFTDDSILNIALDYGYESQQAFTLAFKEMYKRSPLAFRKRREYYPIQLKFNVKGNLDALRGDRIMDIRIEQSGEIHLMGYMANTGRGFLVIPLAWRKLHRRKNMVAGRLNSDFLIGLNDYSKDNTYEDTQPAFDYYAAIEVSSPNAVQNGMMSVSLPASKYAVFTFRGKSKDTLQPVIDYIYKEWLPKSTCQLNELARYDFARYGESVDEKGQSHIEVWLPIL